MIRALIALVIGFAVMMPGIPMTASPWFSQGASMSANDERSSETREIRQDGVIEQSLAAYEPRITPAVDTTANEHRDVPVKDREQSEEAPSSRIESRAAEQADDGYTGEHGWTVNEATVTYKSGDMYAFDDGSHENTVKYRSAWKGDDETKYAHTDNVSDDGVQSGGYGNDKAFSRTITMSGAPILNVTLTYQTESTRFDWVCAYQGTGGNKDCDASLTGKLGGTTQQTKTFTVNGDTVTFWFRSDSSDSNYYGYHATVSGFAGEVNNTILEGTVKTPVIPESNAGNEFLEWNPNPETMPITADMTTEAVYKWQWNEWGTCLWYVDENGVLHIRPKSGDSGELGSTGSMSGALGTEGM